MTMWQQAKLLHDCTGEPLTFCLKAIALATFCSYNVSARGVLCARSLPGLHTYDDIVMLSKGMPDPWEESD